MNKRDAISRLISAGERVRHRYFSDEEWIEFTDGKLYDENGYELDWDEFWSLRNSEAFEDGWETVYGMEQPCKKLLSVDCPFDSLPNDYYQQSSPKINGAWYQPCLNGKHKRR